MGKVLVNESSLTNIADAIREKNGSSDTYKPAEMGEAIRAIESGNNVLEYATQIYSMFKNTEFPIGTELNIKAPNIKWEYGGIGSLFYMTNGLKSVKIFCNERNTPISYDSAFYMCSKDSLEVIDFTEFNRTIKTAIQAFYGCNKLKSILGELDLSNITKPQWGMFLQLSSLEDITFKVGSITVSMAITQTNKLTDISIQSIIDGLATVETAQTLTLHADVKAKLTEAQLTTITSKNWTLA